MNAQTDHNPRIRIVFALNSVAIAAATPQIAPPFIVNSAFRQCFAAMLANQTNARKVNGASHKPSASLQKLNGAKAPKRPAEIPTHLFSEQFRPNTGSKAYPNDAAALPKQLNAKDALDPRPNMRINSAASNGNKGIQWAVGPLGPLLKGSEKVPWRTSDIAMLSASCGRTGAGGNHDKSNMRTAMPKRKMMRIAGQIRSWTLGSRSTPISWNPLLEFVQARQCRWPHSGTSAELWLTCTSCQLESGISTWSPCKCIALEADCGVKRTFAPTKPALLSSNLPPDIESPPHTQRNRGG